MKLKKGLKWLLIVALLGGAALVPAAQPLATLIVGALGGPIVVPDVLEEPNLEP